MKDILLVTASLQKAHQDKIRAFVNECADLQAILDRENTLMLEKGTIVFDIYFARKLHLLEGFDVRIRDIFEMTKSQAPDNLCLHSNLINTIQSIKRALGINTMLHLEDIKKRAERLALIKDGLVMAATANEQDAAVCH